MKVNLPKDFLLILIAGIVLLALIAAGSQGIPEPLPALRVGLGILFVFFIPGYSLQAALFPRRGDLDRIARSAFSFGLSIAILPLMFLVLNAAGLGVQLWPITMVFAVFIFICALTAVFRRRRIPEEEKSETAVRLGIKAWWAAQDRFSRWIFAILGLAILTAVVSGILVSQEAPDAPYTEFYILDSQGLSMDYPREVTAGTQAVCLLGIINHEGQPSDYRIVAVGGGDQALSTSDLISLADGETWQGSLTILVEQPGDGQKVEFLLERVGSPWPYRTLRIWMNVDPAGENTPGPA